jgi:hypothetical protein
MRMNLPFTAQAAAEQRARASNARAEESRRKEIEARAARRRKKEGVAT